MNKEDLQQAVAGGPGAIELDGETYLVSQPTDQDMGSLRQWLRRKEKTRQSPLAALVHDPAFGELSPELQRLAMQETIKLQHGGGSEMTQQAALDALWSVEGARFLAWLLIRKHHPEVTLETFGPPADLAAGLINAGNVDAVFVQISEASGMAKLGNLAGRPGSTKTG